MHPNMETGTAGAKEIMVRMGTGRGPTEPMARIWGLSLPMNLNPRGVLVAGKSETNDVRTVGLGSTELDLEHTDGAQQNR